MRVLGVSGGPRGTHEPGVCLIEDGVVKYALIEERYNRYKNSVSCFPQRALHTLVSTLKVDPRSIDVVAHPGITYEDMKARWPLYLNHNFRISPRQFVPVHHQQCHAASSYYYSKMDEALVLCFDGIGDARAGIIGRARGAVIEWLEEFTADQSLGFFWATVCQYMGFEQNEEAYKVMGLAPYGTPKFDLSWLLSLQNGVHRLDRQYIGDKWAFVSKSDQEPSYLEPLIQEKLGFPRRAAYESLRQVDKDLAASAQAYIEEVLCQLVRRAVAATGIRRVCFAGGVALNSKAIGAISRLPEVEYLFVPPGASDVGLALGAACTAYASITGSSVAPINSPYLGLEYSEAECLTQIQYSGLPYEVLSGQRKIAELLAAGRVIGVARGRSEFGARALGNRSILASPCKGEMRDVVNKKIKFREEYRPFAPSVLGEYFADYFEAPPACHAYMATTVRALDKAKRDAPAVVHVDGTSRPQWVTKELNAPYHDLLSEFHRSTGVPILLNTSFNLKGEPIVETPADALRTFVSSGLDHVVLGNILVSKPERYYAGKL